MILLLDFLHELSTAVRVHVEVQPAHVPNPTQLSVGICLFFLDLFPGTDSAHMATCLQRAEQRWRSEQDSNGYLNHAIDAAYAARALKAVLDSNLTMLEQCFKKVGRVPPSIAVACLMARHRRLGAHSPMKVVPNFVIRYILSILGAPFDLLNDKLYCFGSQTTGTPTNKHAKENPKHSINIPQPRPLLGPVLIKNNVRPTSLNTHCIIAASRSKKQQMTWGTFLEVGFR